MDTGHHQQVLVTLYWISSLILCPYYQMYSLWVFFPTVDVDCWIIQPGGQDYHRQREESQWYLLVEDLLICSTAKASRRGGNKSLIWFISMIWSLMMLVAMWPCLSPL